MSNRSDVHMRLAAIKFLLGHTCSPGLNAGS
jgi:hypothetical protein